MRVVFIGTADFGVPALDWLTTASGHQVVAVITQPDRPAGRDLLPRPSPIKAAALRLQLPIFQPEKIKSPEAIDQLQALQADLFIVAAYGQILPKSVLEMPTVACLNLHASLLPKHRGASPIQTAILSGDRESGVTVMWMDVGLDTGDILLTKSLRIARRETGGSLHDRLAAIAVEAMRETLPLLLDHPPRTPQDNSLATYAAKLSKADGQVQWHLPQRQIERSIRALYPWPGAYTWIRIGDRPRLLKLFTSAISRHTKGAPGQIMRADDRGLLVACGEGGLLLRDLQLEGKRRMRAAEFIRGTPLSLGSLLGLPDPPST